MAGFRAIGNSFLLRDQLQNFRCQTALERGPNRHYSLALLKGKRIAVIKRNLAAGFPAVGYLQVREFC